MALFARRRWPWAAAAAVLVAAVVGLAFWLIAGGDREDEPYPVADPTDVGAYETILTPASDPPPYETPAPVAVAAVLTAPDAELKTFADQTVAATSVNVLSRVGPSVAWIGDDAANRVLLLLVGTEHPFAFGPGAKLTFTGAVRTASKGLGQQLGLSGEDLKEFERQGTYVEVETYTEG